jgi:hypothetical protein
MAAPGRRDKLAADGTVPTAVRTHAGWVRTGLVAPARVWLEAGVSAVPVPFVLSGTRKLGQSDGSRSGVMDGG